MFPAFYKTFSKYNTDLLDRFREYITTMQRDFNDISFHFQEDDFINTQAIENINKIDSILYNGNQGLISCESGIDNVPRILILQHIYKDSNFMQMIENMANTLEKLWKKFQSDPSFPTGFPSNDMLNQFDNFNEDKFIDLQNELLEIDSLESYFQMLYEQAKQKLNPKFRGKMGDVTFNFDIRKCFGYNENDQKDVSIPKDMQVYFDKISLIVTSYFDIQNFKIFSNSVDGKIRQIQEEDEAEFNKYASKYSPKEIEEMKQNKRNHLRACKHNLFDSDILQPEKKNGNLDEQISICNNKINQLESQIESYQKYLEEEKDKNSMVEMKTQMNQIVTFLQNQFQFGQSFQNRIDKLETDNITLDKKMNVILDQIHLLQTQLFPNTEENQTKSINYKKLCEFVQKSQQAHLDLSEEEIEMSKIYNEILNYPVLLHQIDVARHHRILSKALELYETEFHYEQFLNFIFESMTKYQQYETQSLLIYFDETDFSSFSILDRLKQQPEFEDHYLSYRNDRYMTLFHELIDYESRFEELKQEYSNVLIEMNKQFEEVKQQMRQKDQEIEELKNSNSHILDELGKHFSKLNQTIQIQQNQSNETMKSMLTNTQKLSKFDELQQNQSQILNTISQISNNLLHQFPFVSNAQFNGILNYLQHQGKIQLKSGNLEFKDKKITNLIDYSNTDDEYFYLSQADQDTNWIEFNFLTSKIDLSSYQIKSFYNSSNCSHPKTWEIWASNDQKTWDILDKRKDCSDLNGGNLTKHFICQNRSHKHYQYIRFYQFDSWNSKYPYTIMSNFELYGDIYQT